MCFFSSLRSPDANNPVTPFRPNSNSGTNRGKTSYTYTHPRSYDSWEQYKMISRLPRPVTHYGADDDDSSYEVDEDQDVLLPFHSSLKVLLMILLILIFGTYIYTFYYELNNIILLE